jgi:cGMP-dependent protein kinase
MGNSGGKRTKANIAKGTPEQIVASITENKEVGNYLQHIPLLKHCSPGDRAILGGALEEKKFNSGQSIFNQGDIGDGFYLIKEGTCAVNVTQNGQTVKIADLGPRDYFGEAALLASDEKSGTRGASVVATSRTVALFLAKYKFDALFATQRITVNFANRRAAVSAEGRGGGRTNQFEEIKKPADAVTTKNETQLQLVSHAVDDCILFQNLNRAQKRQVVDVFYRQQVPAGVSVIKQGDPGINFYVVESGNFEIFVAKDGRTAKVADFGRGRHFGDLALMYNAKRAATCTASEVSHVWILNRYEFRRIVQAVGEQRTRQYLAFMQSVQLLAPLATYERQQLAEALEEVDYKANHVIFQQGEEGDAMYIVISGTILITRTVDGRTEELLRVSSGGYFGERALLSGEPRAATCTTTTAAHCLKLDLSAFNLLLGPLEELLKRRVQSYTSGAAPETTTAARTETKEPEEKLDRSILQEDLITVATLGRGSFGFVTLVRHRETNVAYALKAISKQQIVETSQEEHILSEKKVMATLQHPFYVNLITTYNSANEVFFLLEPSLGGELFTTLRKYRFFAESTARFYLGHLVLGFEHMHSRNYIYRDLKPENLLIGTDGYLKITDFGFAKRVTSPTYTLCGTPEYLAPEIVANKGHGKGVDWWCCGILLYEMLVSYTPFFHEDFMQMYARINRGKFKKPAQLSRSARDLITELLQTTPSKRLGCTRGGPTAIKDHNFFRGFSWENLLAKRLSAPIIPQVADPFDVSNFDPVEEDHEVPLYDPPEDTEPWDEGF